MAELPMHYRLYGLSRTTGKIVNGSDLRVDSDEEAIRLGHQTYPDQAFEIWCRERRVFTCDPTGTAFHMDGTPGLHQPFPPSRRTA
jgi:hypothetical protein